MATGARSILWLNATRLEMLAYRLGIRTQQLRVTAGMTIVYRRLSAIKDPDTTLANDIRVWIAMYAAHHVLTTRKPISLEEHTRPTIDIPPIDIGAIWSPSLKKSQSRRKQTIKNAPSRRKRTKSAGDAPQSVDGISLSVFAVPATALKRRTNRLVSAWEALTDEIDREGRSRQGGNLIRSMADRTIRDIGLGIPTRQSENAWSALSTELEEFHIVVMELLDASRREDASLSDWFSLGYLVAEALRCPLDKCHHILKHVDRTDSPSPADTRPDWCTNPTKQDLFRNYPYDDIGIAWEDPAKKRLDESLSRLGVTLDQLFRPPITGEFSDPHIGVIEANDVCLPGWLYLETGLLRALKGDVVNADASEVSISNQRPALIRDHLWLHWQEEGGKAESGNWKLGPAGIRDRWNTLSNDERKRYHPIDSAQFKGNSGREKVKQGIKTALKDRKNGLVVIFQGRSWQISRSPR